MFYSVSYHFKYLSTCYTVPDAREFTFQWEIHLVRIITPESEENKAGHEDRVNGGAGSISGSVFRKDISDMIIAQRRKKWVGISCWKI